jgi:hypothetical protein
MSAFSFLRLVFLSRNLRSFSLLQLLQGLGHVIAVQRPLGFLARCLTPFARRLAIVARE